MKRREKGLKENQILCEETTYKTWHNFPHPCVLPILPNAPWGSAGGGDLNHHGSYAPRAASLPVESSHFSAPCPFLSTKRTLRDEKLCATHALHSKSTLLELLIVVQAQGTRQGKKIGDHWEDWGQTRTNGGKVCLACLVC